MWKIPFAIGAVVAALIVAPLGYAVGNLRGGQAAAERARLEAALASMTAERDSAMRDLTASSLMAAAARANADTNRRAADEAEERIHDYARALEARGDAARCLIGDDDFERLSRGGVGSDHAAPARR